ncbi:MAG: cysteine peptidase family C39 domain-containing protein, partial [Bacteroidales bacterium]|nr:cysteine peptidase family C39 domain-containing protein [Bacteroidales bacterium]
MQFPFFAQHDAMDCGPACLRMVAAFHGRFFSLEGLRERAHLSREGVSLLGISEAADTIGLRSTGVLVSFDELTTAPLPCIVHWNQEHFVVVYNMTTRKGKSYVDVADPAGGKQRYTKDEFCRCWISSGHDDKPVGIALLLEPSPEFYTQEDDRVNRRGFSFLLNYIRPYRSFITQVMIGLVIGSLLQLILPFLTQSIVDVGVATNDISYIWLVLIAQLMLIISSTATEFIRGWILLHLGTRVNIALISDFLIKLMRLPMGYFDTKMTGDILQRINDHTRIQHYLTNSSLNILFSAFTIVLFSIVLLLYNLAVFSIFVVGSVLYFSWVWIFMKRREALDHKNFALQSANQSNVIQLVNGMQEIRLNGCEQQKRWEWERLQARMFRLRIKGLALAQYQDSGGVLINQTKNLLITALVAKLVIDGTMTLGMMLAVQYIIGQLNSPVDQLINFLRESQDAKLSLERLGEIHEKEEEEPALHPGIQKIPARQDIVLRNVVFGYDTTRMGSPVIRGI